MEELFRATLTDAAARGRLAALSVWMCAFLDVGFSAARASRQQWTRRSRVGLPSERRTLMISSDIRYAYRSLSRQKLGTGLVIGMLALGIGANVGGVLADQRAVPPSVPVPRARAARLHQRGGAALEPGDDRRQLRRFLALARRSAGVRGHRAVRHARVQRRHRCGGRPYRWRGGHRRLRQGLAASSRPSAGCSVRKRTSPRARRWR